MRELARIFEAAFRKLKPAAALPSLEVEFRPYANVNSTIRFRNGRMLVRLSDLLQKAPRGVLEALALILIGKLYRLPIERRHNARLRRFLNRREVRKQARLVRRLRGRKRLETPRGEVHNLESVFERLNQRYFRGQLRAPALGWSRTGSRTTLAHFDPSHNAITISRRFDSADLPPYVLDYLMYHEMLHLKYPVGYCGGRRRVHSPAFHRDERRFESYEAARSVLKQLPSR